MHLGFHATAEAAAHAYDAKALELRGPGAQLNFPSQGRSPQRSLPACSPEAAAPAAAPTAAPAAAPATAPVPAVGIAARASAEASPEPAPEACSDAMAVDADVGSSTSGRGMHADSNVSSGSGRVLHGGSEVFGGSGRVLHGDSEVVGGSGCVLHGGSKIVGGGGCVLHGGSKVVGGGERKAPRHGVRFGRELMALFKSGGSGELGAAATRRSGAAAVIGADRAGTPGSWRPQKWALKWWAAKCPTDAPNGHYACALAVAGQPCDPAVVDAGDGGDQGGATAAGCDGSLWQMGSELGDDEAQLFRDNRTLYLEYLAYVGCPDTLWSARASTPGRHMLSMPNDVSTKPCGNGRSYLAKGAAKPQVITLLEEVEELVGAWVWRRLGREPTLAEVVMNLPPKLPSHPAARAYTVGADDPRTPLHGQRGVQLLTKEAAGGRHRAQQQEPIIVRGSMLGAYQGLCHFTYRYEALQAAPPVGYTPRLAEGSSSELARNPGVCAAFWEHDLERFAIDVPLLEFNPRCKADELWDGVPAVRYRFRDSVKDARVADGAHQLIVSSFPPGRCGNLMCVVNDRLLPPVGGSGGHAANGHASKISRANATIVNVRALAVPMAWLERRKREGWGAARPAKRPRSDQSAELIDPVGGWAFPFMIAKRDVFDGDDLRYSYGAHFWTGHEKSWTNCQRASHVAMLERFVFLTNEQARIKAELAGLDSAGGAGAGMRRLSLPAADEAAAQLPCMPARSSFGGALDAQAGGGAGCEPESTNEAGSDAAGASDGEEQGPSGCSEPGTKLNFPAASSAAPTSAPAKGAGQARDAVAGSPGAATAMDASTGDAAAPDSGAAAAARQAVSAGGDNDKALTPVSMMMALDDDDAVGGGMEGVVADIAMQAGDASAAGAGAGAGPTSGPAASCRGVDAGSDACGSDGGGGGGNAAGALCETMGFTEESARVCDTEAFELHGPGPQLNEAAAACRAAPPAPSTARPTDDRHLSAAVGGAADGEELGPSASCDRSRLCTFRGVTAPTALGYSGQAAIAHDGKKHCIGSFLTGEAAAGAYDAKALELSLPSEAVVAAAPRCAALMAALAEAAAAPQAHAAAAGAAVVVTAVDASSRDAAAPDSDVAAVAAAASEAAAARQAASASGDGGEAPAPISSHSAGWGGGGGGWMDLELAGEGGERSGSEGSECSGSGRAGSDRSGSDDACDGDDAMEVDDAAGAGAAGPAASDTCSGGRGGVSGGVAAPAAAAQCVPMVVQQPSATRSTRDDDAGGSGSGAAGAFADEEQTPSARTDPAGARTFIGIKERKSGAWQAQIEHGGRLTYISIFATPEEAARAYDAKALQLRGPSAELNFPGEAVAVATPRRSAAPTGTPAKGVQAHDAAAVSPPVATAMDANTGDAVAPESAAADAADAAAARESVSAGGDGDEAPTPVSHHSAGTGGDGTPGTNMALDDADVVDGGKEAVIADDTMHAGDASGAVAGAGACLAGSCKGNAVDVGADGRGSDTCGSGGGGGGGGGAAATLCEMVGAAEESARVCDAAAFELHGPGSQLNEAAAAQQSPPVGRASSRRSSSRLQLALLSLPDVHLVMQMPLPLRMQAISQLLQLMQQQQHI
ncbi:hypothetical protein FOA52_000980 [Chlamydomonas sp. UWO 241]|nr:hypothetical protein FOA52_000980 [Chlamydomonas sp. UWO 241]